MKARTTNNDTALSYSVTGSGNEVIILIHGFLASSRYWRRIVPGLVGAGYTVVSIDLLGFGKAAKPRNITYSYDDQIDYIDRIITDLHLTRPFTIVGHSMGALLGARYGALHPARLKALLLLHPPIYTTPSEAKETLLNTGRLYRYLLESKYRNIGWKVLSSSLVRAIAPHTHHSREHSLANIILKTELLADLKLIHTKTLLLVGLNDRTIYQDNLAAIDSNASLKIVKEEVGHHSVLRQPTLIQKTIIDFISKT